MSEALQISERARSIYRSSLVWDMTVPYGMPAATDGVTLPRFRKTGFGLVSLTLGGDGTLGPQAALANIARVYEACAANPDHYLLARAVDDIDRARTQGKLAIVFNFQDIIGFFALQADLYVFCLGVLDNVIEGFLNDEV